MNKRDHASSKFVQGQLELAPRTHEECSPNHLSYDGWLYWICPDCDGINAYGQGSYDAFKDGNKAIPVGLSRRIAKEDGMPIYECGLCDKRSSIDMANRRRSKHMPFRELGISKVEIP